jgi:hypothetical protein
MHRDGGTYWKLDQGIRTGITVILSNEEGSQAKVTIKHSDGSKKIPEGFAGEAWYQAAFLRFGEARLFGDDIFAVPPYIRAFLGEYTLARTECERPKIITCYPVVKLYESGVLLLELRIISPQHPVPLEEFIKEYVNIYTGVFDEIEVSPALAKLAPRVYMNYTLPKISLLDRFRLKKMGETHDKTVNQLTEDIESGDFTFKSAPLPSVAQGKSEPLISLVQTVFGVVAFVVSSPREGRRLLLLGQRPLIEQGNYWEGRPHIHIVRHDEQAETPAENEERHRESFRWILSRVSKVPPVDRTSFLPANARLFADYAAYITCQATLWVWSKNGLKAQKKWEDANRGHLIYEHQAHAEMMEYGYMLHRSMAEGVTSVRGSRDVTRLRRKLSELKSRMRQSSHYGEVTNLLSSGWESMGVQDLREEIAEGLAIREAEAQIAEMSTTERLGRAFTILFGLMAVPPLATEVIQPVWELLSLWRPSNPAAAKWFMIFVALILVSATIYGLLWKILKGNRSEG